MGRLAFIPLGCSVSEQTQVDSGLEMNSGEFFDFNRFLVWGCVCVSVKICMHVHVERR